MSRCVIFAAVEPSMEELAFLRTLDYAGCFILCADAGYRTALALGLRPDWIVGDFDHGDVLPPEEYPVLRAEAAKDDTDTMLAARLAVERGYREVTLLCGLGGRLDHTLANLQTLAFLLEQGVEAAILSARDMVCLLRNGKASFPRGEDYFSVFAYTPVCLGVTLEGFRFPLTEATVTHAFPIGVSNEIAAEEGIVTVREGTLLLIRSKETHQS